MNGVVLNLLGNAEFTVWTSVLTVALLYFYFYYDFAGYSDIAIGFGLLLGIKGPGKLQKAVSGDNCQRVLAELAHYAG